jgi:hypothetical protein
VIAAPEFCDVVAQLPERSPTCRAFDSDEVFGGDDVTGDDPLGERFGERGMAIRIAGDGFVGEMLGEVARLAQGEPIAESALAPFREVLGVDGAPGEIGGEDGADFREGVEPGGECFPCRPSRRPSLSCSRRAWGRRAIFPIRVMFIGYAFVGFG